MASKILKSILTICGSFWVAAVLSPWEIVVPVTDADAIDNVGGVLNPDTQITRDRFTLDRRGVTTLKFRVGYTGTVSTSVVIRVWGRTLLDGQTTGGWKRLYNKADTPTTDIALTSDATNDYTDGTSKYSNDNPKDHCVDVDGCDEFVVEIYTAFAGSVPASSFIQVQRV